MGNRSRDGHTIVWEIDDVTARRITECLLAGSGLKPEESGWQPKFANRYRSIADDLGDRLDALPKRERNPHKHETEEK